MRSAKYFLYSNLDSTLLSVMSHKISIPKLKSYLDTIDSLFEVSEPIFLKFIQFSEEQDSDTLVALVDQISSHNGSGFLGVADASGSNGKKQADLLPVTPAFICLSALYSLSVRSDLRLLLFFGGTVIPGQPDQFHHL